MQTNMNLQAYSQQRAIIPCLLLGAALLAGLLLITLSVAHSATITVNTITDESDGSCSDGDCSLRDAIAVATPGDTIAFGVTGTIALTLGQITIGKNLTIEGPGASSLTISGNNSSRVFNIWMSGVNVTISGVTIANGKAGTNGGGIFNAGTLTVTNSTFSANRGAWGGGIYNLDTLTVTNSTFAGNSATYEGGGIDNGGTLTVTNSTLSANSAPSGGGIYNGSGNSLTVNNSTFSANSATTSGGGIRNRGTATLVNTIVANSTAGGDCSGTFAAASTNNLAADATCTPGFDQVTSAELGLGSLTGSPAYYPLNPGSAAIDTGTNVGCPTADQPGNPRPLVARLRSLLT